MANQGLDPLKRFVVKGIAGGIGLASESFTAYQARRKTSPKDANTPREAVLANEPAPPKEGYSELEGSLSYDGVPLSREEESQWELDETQDQILPPRSLEEDQQIQVDEQEAQRQVAELGASLALRYPPPADPKNISNLSASVILPQRRPKSRQRGFIRAYAPVLESSAISQDMFLDFLETFHKSSQASPWFAALNLAAMGLSCIPHLPMIVGIAMQAAIKVAEDVQTRTRTNSFLDKANTDFFSPRGLYCLIMTYNPDSTEGQAIDQAKLSSTVATNLNPSGLQKVKHKLRSSSGEIEFPECAPLVFPGLDDLDDQQSTEATAEKEKFGAKKHIDEYFDKRAQAKFAGKHPDSMLAQGPQPTFTSRYADPNHPASSGSFRSLITGGRINPPPMTRYGFGGIGGFDRSQRGGFLGLDGLRRGAGDKDEGQNRCEGRRGLGVMSDRGPVGLLGLPNPGVAMRKALKKNVLYLMIVNMPSEEELADAMAEIQRQRASGFKLPSFIARL
ncbi:hypothetical protein G7Z17_g1448 [Cylindrodendrum hubeiense]|uniref:Uncharacterized protein n=1 Tax=Cylindrodendrum hubeiense TaxID=595255 RepID=A0A9P5LCI6_9HYPO|nr:hypothetical protein G7Z17_g1448 [Cylindrodendrum hubeiense]